MKKLSLSKIVFIVFAVCIATAIPSSAQGFTVLYSFCSQPNCADGDEPYAVPIQATDGNFYGTTGGGGTGSPPSGTVFRITAAGTLTTLYSFCSQPNCTDGAGTQAGLIQASDGNFYSTAGGGGTFGKGTAFRITPAGALTTLYNFCPQPNCADGAGPQAGVIQATDGNFYGTTALGGATGYGTAFQITPAGALTTLYSFCSQPNCADGEGPEELLQASDGNFYGTTDSGGIIKHQLCGDGCGTLYKITPGGALTTLYLFCSQPNCADGYGPSARLIQASDGNLYGTTFNGSTIFKITLGGTLTTLYRFCSQKNCTDGLYPIGLVQAKDGNLYGTTEYGGIGSCYYGYGCGTVFRFIPHPVVQLRPTQVNFGQQALAETSAPQTVALTNAGGDTLDIANITASGDFAISASTCGATLAAGKICKLSVTFTPTQLGPRTGALTFTDNAPDSPQTVSLSGTGVPQATLLPASANYGNQKVGTTSASKKFTLTNNQLVPLTGIAISTTGDFAVSATTCGTSLAKKSRCTISVTFTPTQTGTRTGQLSVSDSANNSPQAASLTGTGT